MGILALAVVAVVIVALLFASKKAASPCRLLAPSVLAVCACAVTLSATTYAWFTATTSSQVATIQSATYEVDVVVDNAAGEWYATHRTYSVTLDAGTTYVVNLTATGNATKGYCVVTLNGETSYTPEILTAEDNTFTFSISGEGGALTITPMWGDRPSAANEDNTLPPADLTTADLFAMFMTPEPPEENPADATYPVSDDTETPETPVVPKTQSAPPAPEPAVSETVPEIPVE